MILWSSSLAPWLQVPGGYSRLLSHGASVPATIPGLQAPLIKPCVRFSLTRLSCENSVRRTSSTSHLVSSEGPEPLLRRFLAYAIRLSFPPSETLTAGALPSSRVLLSPDSTVLWPHPTPSHALLDFGLNLIPTVSSSLLRTRA
jgi:hypothetical protein